MTTWNRSGRTDAMRCISSIILVGLMSIWSGAARAELQRVEAVGIYGIRNSMRTRVIPRDEAIARARWEGVSRVALELIGESVSESVDLDYAVDDSDDELDRKPAFPGGRQGEGVVPPLDGAGAGGAVNPAREGAVAGDARLEHGTATKDEVAVLESALGKDMLPYTRSYRILEDQGELPVLFADSPGIETEYVVVVEVIVDVDRVSSALVRAGLLASADPVARDAAVTLELVGLDRYEALERVLAALRDAMGATRVQTLAFERGKQVLSVEGPFAAEALSRRLARYRDPRLSLEPIGIDPISGRIRVMARWFDEPSDTY